MDLREAKRILAYVEGELTLTSKDTDWEKLSKMIYSVGSSLLDRAVEVKRKKDEAEFEEHLKAKGEWKPAPGAKGVLLLDELNGIKPDAVFIDEAAAEPKVVTNLITGSLFGDCSEADFEECDCNHGC